MTEPDQPHDSSLRMPAAAEKALRRATSHTLTSLALLRKALREHVHSERDRNTALAEIEAGLRALVARERQDLPVVGSDVGSHDNLSELVTEWTEFFFRAPPDRL
jgi:hypothetical protein